MNLLWYKHTDLRVKDHSALFNSFIGKNKVLVVSHEPLLSDSITNFFIGSQNKHYLRAKAEYTTSAFFNVSFNCSDWDKIRKSNSSINFYVKPKDL